jgi:hypothetical protein
MTTIAEVFYGVLWRIEKDDEEAATQALSDALQADDDTDLNDLMDMFESKFDDTHVVYHDSHKTIYIGLPLSSTNETENEFNEMALIRIMDLDKGVLKDGIRKQVRDLLENVPVDLRDKFTAPGFYTVWQSA